MENEINIKIGDKFDYFNTLDALEEMKRLNDIGVETELITHNPGAFIQASLKVVNIRND